MTTPPYGPYGQGPPGPNPYGPDPYWGRQPPGGQPPGGPYQAPQGYPYGPPPYGAPPYPPPGQQFPPGGPGGYYPPGPPPRPPGSKAPWLIGAGIVVAIIAVVVATVLLLRAGHNESGTARPSPGTAGPLAPSSVPGAPLTPGQNATDCTPNVSAGTPPAGDIVSAGALSFPAGAAPGWAPFADDSTPNGIDVAGLAAPVPGAEKWVMQAEVGITNFVSSMDVAAQASKLMTCVVGGPGYEMASPSLGPTKTSSIMVDGTQAARVDADITIADTSQNVKGDSVVIIVVKTKPAAFFYGATPIGDADARGTIERVISALTVTNR
ncbi:hypothetical protein [Mycobacterium sp.]|uniref:hypothetical protein n=1 Tax=Mycobacterium sp. TaxID=1785 RepID=UPI003D6A28F4